jgi:hypothetical protein
MFESELSGDLLADLITTSADPRSDGGMHVGGRSPELGLHFFKRFLNDVGNGATPSGMHRGDGPVTRVGEKNRIAVRCANGDRQADAAGHEGISFTA